MTQSNRSHGNGRQRPQTDSFQEGKVNKGGQNPPPPSSAVRPPKPAPMSPQPSAGRASGNTRNTGGGQGESSR